MSNNLVRHAMQRLVLPLGDLTPGQSVMKHLSLFHDAQYWSAERLKLWQDERVRETVRVAYEETDFYRSLYDSAGVRPADIQCTEDLQKLPIVTKDLLRPVYPQGCTRKSVTRFTEISTSGSTGSPFKVRVDAQ